jgi:hypothetical protein
MSLVGENNSVAKNLMSAGEGFCPECGAIMHETARTCENGSLYIWYECKRSNCDGQWLHKSSATLKNIQK